MDCLADTNVLIRTIDRLHAHHPIALNALDRILRGGGHVYVAAQNLIEFWSVCSRPVQRNGLGLTTTETERELSRLEELFAVLPEVPAIYPAWRRLTKAYSVVGIDVFDARLVAVMNVYGVSNLLTFNGGDFTGYSEINILDPSTIR